MNESTLIKLSQKLEKELEFICESVSITDEDILPIRECAPLISAMLTLAIEATDLEIALVKYDEARRACVEIDKMLILMYATNIISRETFTRMRNSYASLGRNLAARCTAAKKKLRLQKARQDSVGLAAE